MKQAVVVAFFKYFKSRLFAFAGGSPPLHPPPLRGGSAYRPGDYAKFVGELPTIYRLLGQAVFRRENVSCMLKNLCLAGKS